MNFSVRVNGPSSGINNFAAHFYPALRVQFLVRRIPGGSFSLFFANGAPRIRTFADGGSVDGENCEKYRFAAVFHSNWNSTRVPRHVSPKEDVARHPVAGKERGRERANERARERSKPSVAKIVRFLVSHESEPIHKDEAVTNERGETGVSSVPVHLLPLILSPRLPPYFFSASSLPPRSGYSVVAFARRSIGRYFFLTRPLRCSLHCLNLRHN